MLWHRLKHSSQVPRLAKLSLLVRMSFSLELLLDFSLNAVKRNLEHYVVCCMKKV